MRHDEIGYWSELKHEIIEKYAKAYSTIMSSEHQSYFKYYYIDGFAGPGEAKSRTTGQIVPGSPLTVLDVKPPFDSYCFVEYEPGRADNLRHLIGDRPNVHIYTGDCNSVLLDHVLPQIIYDRYRRALCLLDPYGLHLDWKVFHKAGEMGTIDLFLNFPVMDMNRRVQWKHPENATSEAQEAMTRFWGDDSWRDLGRKAVPSLFGNMDEEAETIDIALAFGERLKEHGGFKVVSRPLPMRNSKNSVLYYLMLASQKKVAVDIANRIFSKYDRRSR